MMGISPVAAGTLDANQQVSQVSERPKLNYVNPDAKTMSLGEIKEAFKPKNLFGYKDKFGRFDIHMKDKKNGWELGRCGRPRPVRGRARVRAVLGQPRLCSPSCHARPDG